MSTVEERVKEFGGELIRLGYPVVSAAAICGNAWLESGVRPIAPSRDGSDGALQWRNAADVHRLTEMQAWCASKGMDWHTLQAQAQFTAYELVSGYQPLERDLRAGVKPLATLTLNFTDEYEKPAASGRVPDTRIKYAEQSLAILQDLLPSPTPTTTPVPGSRPPIPIPSQVPYQGVPTLPPAVVEILVQVASALAQGIISAIIQHAGAAAAPSTVHPPAAPFPLPPAPAPIDLSAIEQIVLKAVQAAINPTQPK